jgi:uncharacterized protein YjbI with pentapeptide repeats
MPNTTHLAILDRGVAAWNKWRADERATVPDLAGASLARRNLSRADFRDARMADVNLEEADLRESNFCHTDLSNTNLRRSKLFRADFFSANLCGADLSEADMEYTILVQTNLDKAKLRQCQIYGISVWSVKGKPDEMSDLFIRCPDGNTITVDNLEVAQFLYILFDNKRIRDALDSMASQVVLILGRFTKPRKIVLDKLRVVLRSHDYTPVMFDFERPIAMDHIETVSTLAHLAKFVLADFTDAKIVLEEVPHIVRNRAVPVKPLLLDGMDEPTTLRDLRRSHRSICSTFWYRDCEQLVGALEKEVLADVENKVKELARL